MSALVFSKIFFIYSIVVQQTKKSRDCEQRFAKPLWSLRLIHIFLRAPTRLSALARSMCFWPSSREDGGAEPKFKMRKFEVEILFKILIFVNLAISVVKSEGLLSDFLSYDGSKVTNLTKVCAHQCQQLKVALQHDKIWALKVNDASGRKSIEYFWGNNYFFGSESACKLLNDPPKIDLVPKENRIMDLSTLTIKSEFPVEYRVIYYTHRSPLQFNAEMFNRSILHVGLCLPKSCTNFDMEILSNILIENSFSDKKVYGDVEFVSSKRLALRPNPLDSNFVSSFMWVAQFHDFQCYSFAILNWQLKISLQCDSFHLCRFVSYCNIHRWQKIIRI